MFRKSVVKYLIFFLFIFIGSILYFQWHGYSSGQKKQEVEKASQTITIEHNNRTFYIKQVIHPLSSGTYSIEWPSSLENLKCIVGEKQQKCIWENENKSKLKVNSDRITFQYELKEKGNQVAFLLKDWFFKLSPLKIEDSKINLIEKQYKHGNWITSSNNTTIKQKKWINYFVFDYKGQASNLYWQNNELVGEKINDWLTIYHQKTINLPSINMSLIEKLIKKPNPIAVIMTNSYPQTLLPSLLILNPNASPQEIEERISREVIRLTLTFKTKEEWMSDIIVSAQLNRAVGSNKAKKMYENLTATIGEEKLNHWVERIFSETPNMTSEKLDQIFEKTTGYGTTFFLDNHIYEFPMKPFITFDPRSISVNGKEISGLHLYSYQDKKYLSFLKLAKALGYEIKNNEQEQTIILTSGENQFHFYLQGKTFTFNGDKYGLLSNPFFKLNQEYFIDINWVKQIFNTKISETNKEIQIFD
ncbi:stalk domain-containing protein [Heyndrickxia oleronia]|jgi:hypothetical protein|nr:stalk domain-containing protein [Heyndrickxia oleronia]MCI1589742.1 copper amine oxidase N-terminal domain-containing protein [Heyndrickxia oleronia]MCI1611511.1 copper amine oxidase N-terminal domain-containing protein [Heyndrickxia oleronia]MCI1742953.1 copper amine oxidase N-terminal domain-containing protein [Heyndrickxia oleronia]MCI1760033.1 copper amine oxidase N-terminal domain-containing protein [Heyndrickxia oleronia]MEC1376044.1 stalk domain-containing protein [Heyndrickxia olero